MIFLIYFRGIGLGCAPDSPKNLWMVQKHGTINEYFTVQHGIVSLIIYVYVIVWFIIYVSGYIRRAERTQEKEISSTQGQSGDTVKESATWKVSKYGVFSGPYFPAFGPEKTSAFGHFSRSGHDVCSHITRSKTRRVSSPAREICIVCGCTKKYIMTENWMV